MIKGVVRLVLGGNMKLRKFVALATAGVICLSALMGCSAKPEDTIAVLGEENVSFGVANFIVKYQKASMDDIYAMYATMYGVDSLWDVDATGSGSTTEVQMKNTAMDLIHEMYTLKSHMSEYGVEITEEESAAIKEAANAFLAANSEEAIEEFGATEEIVTEVLTLYTIQSKMYDAIIADADREVSDEEANMRGYSMIYINLSQKTNEDGTTSEYTEEELAEIKTKALEMGLDLKVKTMEEVAAENGYQVTTGAYGKEDTSIDAAVLTALDELKEGEVSGLVETEKAIYFLRVDADTDKTATEQKRASIIEEREFALYEEVVTGWQENDGWDVNDSLVKKIEFHNIFTKYKETEEDSTEAADVSETVDGTESN